jgi:uncharacterized small protein (TIGR04563 family)
VIPYELEVRVAIDKRKQSLYFPEAMLKDLQLEATRLERSLSWVVQRCVRAGLPTLEKLPSTGEPARPDEM